MVPESPRRQVAAFLALLVLVRGPFYAAAIAGGWGNTSRNVPFWMMAFVVLSAPPFLAVTVRWWARRSLRSALRDLGWRSGRPAYLLAGWAAPIVVALAVYGAAWALGAAELVPHPAALGTLAGATVATTLGLVVPTLLFEELAWRGFLVPALARFLPFGGVALVSGAVWALFHYPFLFAPAYAHTRPTLLSVGAFTAAAMALSVPLAWLRLRSGSVWPAVLAHAAHNAFAAGVLARAFRPRGAVGAAVLGAPGAGAGVGLALGYGVLAWWTWRHRGAVSEVARPVVASPESASSEPAALEVARPEPAGSGPVRRVVRALRPAWMPSAPRLLGAALLTVGLGHLAYGLVQRATAVSAAAYLVLAACAALGGWLVGRGGPRSRPAVSSVGGC